MKPGTRSFNFRISYILYFMIAVVFTVQSVTVAMLLNEQKFDSLRINLTGRQRMLSQKLVKDLLLLNYKKTAREEIRWSIDVFDRTIKGLTFGGEVPFDLDTDTYRSIPPLKDRAIVNSLLQVLEKWQLYREKAVLFIETGDRGALGYIIEHNETVLYDIDRIVGEMEKISEDRTRKLQFAVFSEAFLIIAMLGVMLLIRMRDIKKAKIHIMELEKMLPICANCKKIRKEDGDPFDRNSWVRLEEFMKKERDITFSHGLCPDCAEKLYPGILKESKEDK